MHDANHGIFIHVSYEKENKDYVFGKNLVYKYRLEAFFIFFKIKNPIGHAKVNKNYVSRRIWSKRLYV